MKALDLFCCAGGASAGLALAGFEVTGLDNEPQSEYPFEFVEKNALDVPVDFIRQFDLVWASPPCQAFTAYKRRHNHVADDHPNLIPATRDLLREAGVPFIIENVEGARDHLAPEATKLCGSMFGLDVRRHRLFETSFPVEQPKCAHHVQTPRFPPAGNRTNLRSTVEVGVWRIPLDIQQWAMGIGWMSRPKLSQAIPPRYSHYLAEQFKL